MKKFAIAMASLACLALLALAVRAASLKSGPQVGEEVPGPFEPLNVTGEDAGDHVCLYCKNGAHPVAMIFARQPSPAVVSLIKKIDRATAEHRGDKMGSFVVFLSDDSELPKKLKEIADKEHIDNTVLAVDKVRGPAGYEINPDADVTVVLYTRHTVKANHTFEKGGLKDKDVDRILADLPKILPEK
jgi:hypothetical protein